MDLVGNFVLKAERHMDLVEHEVWQRLYGGKVCWGGLRDTWILLNMWYDNSYLVRKFVEEEDIQMDLVEHKIWPVIWWENLLERTRDTWILFWTWNMTKLI